MCLISSSFIIQFPCFLSLIIGASAAAVLDWVADLITNKALQSVLERAKSKLLLSQVYGHTKCQRSSVNYKSVASQKWMGGT